MAVYHADALVIRSREYGESDRMLTLFSREKGKLQAVAKGVRKPKSRQRAGAQLFTYADFLLHRGKTLDTVNQVHPKESFPYLWDDLDRTLAATAIAELLDIATIAGEPQEELFILTLTCFFLLEHYDPLLVQGAYTLHLTKVLGYLPELEKCSECGEPANGEKVFFSPEAGGILCSSCNRYFSGSQIHLGSTAFMRQLVKSELTKIDRLRWNDWMKKEVTEILQDYCEQKFERKLRSWSMGKSLTDSGVRLHNNDGKDEQ